MMDVDFVRKYYEKQSEPFNNACEEMIKHRDQMDSAQLQTAEDLKKLREQFEESQRELAVARKEQAKSDTENLKLAIKAYRVSLIATIFGGLSLFIAFASIALQALK